MNAHRQVRKGDTSWMTRAACVEVSGLPWTECTRGMSWLRLQVMLATCARCPVREQCAAFAEEVGVTAGVWAGVDYGRTREPAENSGDAA